MKKYCFMGPVGPVQVFDDKSTFHDWFGDSLGAGSDAKAPSAAGEVRRSPARPQTCFPVSPLRLQSRGSSTLASAVRVRSQFTPADVSTRTWHLQPQRFMKAPSAGPRVRV